MCKLIVEYSEGYVGEPLAFAHSTDACFDFYNNEPEPITLQPLERHAFATGIKVEFPEGYVLTIHPRSGNALKKGIGMLNSEGIIDQGYRGEIKAILFNGSNETITINPGDKIAQGRLEQLVPTEIVAGKVDENTDRGANGFGSTGM